MKSALKKVSLILAICFVAFHLYTAAFGTMPGIAQKSIHLGFLLVIFYINAMVDSEKRWEQIFLGIMALFALGGCAYITILDENLQLRAGIVYASDILFAILLIIAIFEACRRKMGNPLVIITLVFVAYAFLGKYIPGFLNQPGMTLKKFTSLVYLTTDGIFGSPLYASASYVVLFVLLGAIMSVSGIGDYMTNLATSLFGHMRGGPAKVAVVASGFFGSISGSPTANVIGTGTFTIPMMKKNGFEPEFAAAVEATASTGGAIMPPIMGSTAFIMAEMLGIPYTGSGVLASALAMDKAYTKHLFENNHVPTARCLYLNKHDAVSPKEQILKELGLPVVVKPVAQGSSIGVVIVKSEAELDSALEEAFSYGDRVLAEAFFKGKEVAAGVMMGEDGKAIPMPLVLIEPHSGSYDFHSKYTKGATTYTCPAPFSEETTQKLQQVAVAAYNALGCHGVARVDLMLADDGSCIALEVNSIPGMTATSLIPKAAAAMGISFPDLCEKILLTAH